MSFTGKDKSAPKSEFTIKPNKPWSECDLDEKLDAIHEKLCALPSCVEVGCIKDESGVEAGKVLACFTADSVSYTAIFPGQEPIENYTGEWELCDSSTSMIPLNTVCYE